MNNYPDGCNGRAENYTAEYICQYCEKQWEVPFTSELGYNGPINNDDICCPECGTEGEMK